MMTPTRFFATLFLLSLTRGPNLEADIIFARDGQNLLVTIDQTYRFDVTTDANRSEYGITFYNVYSLAPDQFALETPFVQTSRMEIDSLLDATSASYGSWGHTGVVFNDVGVNDFWGRYRFGGFRSVAVGDEVSITPGVITIDSFFDNANARLPDQSTAVLQLTDDIGRALSAGPAGAAVPEPASAALLVLLTGGAFVYRRNQQARSLNGRRKAGLRK